MYVDNLRFITQVNTQVRTLVTLTQLVRTLGTKQLPKQLLKKMLEKWSAEEEDRSIEYKKHRGKITKEGGKPTTAFNHYLDFAALLGLITKHSDIVMCSRMGMLLDKITDKPKNSESQMSCSEKLFYLIILFNNDADVLLLAIDLLLQQYDKPAQERLLESFGGKLSERLLIKQKHANTHAQSVIRSKYQQVNYRWQNAESYAKHIIPPRLEWMKDLGILETINKGTYYQLTEQGKHFYHSLPRLPDSIICDVNEDWLKTKAMAAYAPLVFPENQMICWTELNAVQRIEILSPLLEESFNLFNTEGVRRISLYPSSLFIIINLALKNVTAEIQDVENELKKGIITGCKNFSVRPAARINEAYITINQV